MPAPSFDPAPSILIAEDEAFLRELLYLDVSNHGYPVFLANDGLETIHAIEEHHPAVLLLDLLMPRLDGYGVLEYIHSRGYDFPVLILSNLSDPLEQEKCSRLGAKGFLIKSNLDEGDIWQHLLPYLPALSQPLQRL